jgi:hypothetical protein
MAFEMIDREVRFAKANRLSFGIRRANHERTRQTGSAGCRKYIDHRHVDLCIKCRLFQKSRRVHKMIARSNLGYDPAMFFMLGDLGSDFAGKQLQAGVAVAPAQNRDGGFVA